MMGYPQGSSTATSPVEPLPAPRAVGGPRGKEGSLGGVRTRTGLQAIEAVGEGREAEADADEDLTSPNRGVREVRMFRRVVRLFGSVRTRHVFYTWVVL